MFIARVIRALAEGGAFTLYGDGGQSRSFTYVADVVRATIDAMGRAAPGTLYNVGGGQEATVNEAIGLLEQIAGRPLDVTRAARVPGDVPRTKADTTRIRDDLGWEPIVRLEDGLRSHWEWATRSSSRPS
jgi:nucleoside-diphosphate-sugar epimerase